MAPFGVCQLSIKADKDGRAERHPDCRRIKSGEEAGRRLAA